MKNIYTLPTDNPSRLVGSRLNFSLKDIPIPSFETFKTYNIYITSDEKIKKGDWCINTKNNNVMKVGHHGHHGYSSKKIILTTDPDLINDGVQVIDDEFLEWFVKNPSCEKIEVEKEKIVLGEISRTTYTDFKYKIIIPKEELKQEITIEEIERQIISTEARGEKIVKYLDKYKGQSIYNEIALAIEFGYQLKLEEDE